MLTGFFIGLVLGALTSVPIGLANAAVVDTAYRRGLRRALGVALGGAAADAVHSFLGVAGAGALIARHPAVPPIFCAVSALVLAAYGTHLLRAPAPPEGAPREAARGLGTGLALGLSLTLFNPAALLAWIAVGSLLAVPSAAGAAWVAAGVGVGAFGVFALLAWLTRRGVSWIGRRAPWLSRALGCLLIGLALFGAARALSYL